LDLEAWVLPNESHILGVGIHPHNFPPGNGELFLCPIYFIVGGSDSSTTHSRYSLPDTHPFGRELKAATLGNPCPAVTFHLGGADADSPARGAFLRGTVRVRCAGPGIFPPVRLGSCDYR
jgi:hypothetical protein